MATGSLPLPLLGSEETDIYFGDFYLPIPEMWPTLIMQSDLVISYHTS